MTALAPASWRFAYADLVREIAPAYGLDPDLVIALCLVESSGNPKAYRFEPAFFRRYMAHDPRWRAADPKRVSASYGLTQVMFLVAVEFGFPDTDDPELLFDPRLNLHYGCKVLAERMAWVAKAAADVSDDVRLRAALASYNGGKGGNAADHRPDRNAQYAAKVLARLADVHAGRVTDTPGGAV